MSILQNDSRRVVVSDFKTPFFFFFKKPSVFFKDDGQAVLELVSFHMELW